MYDRRLTLYRRGNRGYIELRGERRSRYNFLTWRERSVVALGVSYKAYPLGTHYEWIPDTADTVFYSDHVTTWTLHLFIWVVSLVFFKSVKVPSP